MSVLYIILSSWLSVYQKFSNLVEIWWSSDKNKLVSFFWHTLYFQSKTLVVCWQNQQWFLSCSLHPVKNRGEVLIRLQIKTSPYFHWANYILNKIPPIFYFPPPIFQSTALTKLSP